MANGLRKLIRRTRKQFNNPSKLTRRINRFGPRLRVEELEERIAPAAGLTGTGAIADDTVTLNADGETAIMENAAGDIWTFTLGAGGITAGDVMLTFDSATIPTKVTVMDFGNGAGLTGAADAEITLVLTNDAGSAAMAVDSVMDTNTNTSTTSFVGTDDTTADLITVGAVALGTSTVETWNTGDITSFTAIGVDTSMRVGAVAVGGIVTTTDFLGTLTVTGLLSGPVESALTIGDITLQEGSAAAGDITATLGNVGNIVIGEATAQGAITVAGDIVSTAGSIGTVNGVNETSITISGALTAATGIGTIGNTNDEITLITGAITAQTIAAIDIAGNLTGGVYANVAGGAGTVGAIDIGSGTLGAVTASGTTGSIGAITAAAITAAVTATDTDAGNGNTIGAITVSGAVSGAISGYTIADIDITGALTSLITAANGFDAADNTLAVGGGIGAAGGLVATANGFAADTITITGDLDGKIEATAGNIAATINISGEIDETTDVVNIRTVSATGNITGAITIGTNLAGSITSGNNITNTITLTAGDLSGAITAAGAISQKVTVTDGDMDGTITATGNITGGVELTDGRFTGTISSTGGNISAGAIQILNGTPAEVGENDGVIAGYITANDETNGAITAAITAEEGITGGTEATPNIVAANAVGAITILDGDLDGYVKSGTTMGAVDVQDGNVGGSIIVGTNLTSLTVTDDTPYAAGTETTDDGNIDDGAVVTATGTIGAIALEDTLNGDITASGYTATVETGVDAATSASALPSGGISATGSITATTGNFAGLVKIWDGGMAGLIKATAGNIAGGVALADTVTSATTGGVDDDATLSGTIFAGGSITTVGITIADGITVDGIIEATTSITTTIGITDGGFAGTITSATISGNITIGDGADTAESGGTDEDDDDIIAATGLIETTGDLTGNIIADGGIVDNGKIEAGGSITGNITIFDPEADLAGDIEANTNITGEITVPDDVAATASIKALTGNFGSVAGQTFLDVGGDIKAGAVITAEGDLLEAIEVGGAVGINLTFNGDVSAGISAASYAGGAITVGGSIITNGADMTIEATNGDLPAITVTGDIYSEDVNDEITIRATGSIGAIIVGGGIGDDNLDGNLDIIIEADAGIGAVLANNIGDVTSIAAGGAIDADITGENIGTITSGGTAADDITGVITAVSDADGVDAGFGTVSAVVSAGAAASGSPLVWVVAEGVAYCVWALNPSTGLEMAGITANITFNLDEDGDGVDDAGDRPTITITAITGTTLAAPVDLKIVTVLDNGGAAPLLTDTDIDLDDIGSELEFLFTSATDVYLNDLVIEGRYTTAGTDLDIHVAGETSVEGGIGGTFPLNLTEQLNYVFRSIAGDTTFNFTGAGSPTITVLEGIEDELIVKFIGRDIAGLYVGDASMDKIADIGADSSITAGVNDIDEIVVAGDLNGSITAAQIGDVIVGGDIGDDNNDPIELRATAGSIGDISVTGDIDISLIKAENTANQSLATIGMIVAGGDIADDDDMTISAGGDIAGVHAGGFIGYEGETIVTITSLQGGIGVIIADGDNGDGYAMDIDVNVAGDIDLVSATADGDAAIAGMIQSRDGDIGTVQTVNSDIDATIKALTGDIDEVKIVDLYATLPTGGTIYSPLISAGGDIDLIQGNDIDGDTVVIADAATGESPVTTWISGTVKYEFTAEGGGDTTFSYTWQDGEIDITVNNQGEIDTEAIAAAAVAAADDVDATDGDGTDDVAEVVAAAKAVPGMNADGDDAVDAAAVAALAAETAANAAATAADAVATAAVAAAADLVGPVNVAAVADAAKGVAGMTAAGETAIDTAVAAAQTAEDAAQADVDAADAVAVLAVAAADAVDATDSVGTDDVAEVVTAAKGVAGMTAAGETAIDTAAADALTAEGAAAAAADTAAAAAVTDSDAVAADGTVAAVIEAAKAAAGMTTAGGAVIDADAAVLAAIAAYDAAAEGAAGDADRAAAVVDAKAAIAAAGAAGGTISDAEEAALLTAAIALAKTDIAAAEADIATALLPAGTQAALDGAITDAVTAIAAAEADISEGVLPQATTDAALAAAVTLAKADIAAAEADIADALAPDAGEGEADISIMLTTTYADTLADPTDELQVPDSFDLNSLDFTIDSTADDLATLLVEGDVTGLVDVGSVTNFIVQGDVAVPVQLAGSSANPLEFVAMSTAMGNDDPTAAEMTAMFTGATFTAPAVDTTYSVPVTGADGDVSVSIPDADGNLITPAVLNIGGGAGAVATFIVTVTETGLSFTTIRDARGDISIAGDLEYVIYASNLDAVTITGSVTADGGIDAYDIGALTIGTQFDLTDGVGDLAGFIRSIKADNDAGAGGNDDGNIGAVRIYGNILADAFIYAEGDVTSITVGQIDYDYGQMDKMVGSVAGEIIVLGTCGDITSEGTLGGLIMIGGNSGNITSNESDVTADIFIGGTDGTDDVAITGNTITGKLAIGAIGGVDSVTLSVRTTAENGDPVDYSIVTTAGAGMLVEVAADAVSAASATIAAVTIFEDSGVLTATCDAHDNFNVSNVYVLENSTAALNITVPGALGLVAAADGMTPVMTSSAIADTFSTDYDMFKFDMVSPHDAANTDDADIAISSTIVADSVGGVLATGNVNVTANNLDDFGYLLSLNGDVDANITANNSIGDIAASDDIDLDLDTEGVIALGGGTAMQADVAALGLSGLPAWFAGGILSEVGNIDIYADADGEQTLVAGIIPISNGYAMGTIYAMLGDVDGDLDLGAGFGGVVAPLTTSLSSLTVNVPLSSQIDRFVAPYANSPGGQHPSAQLELLDGEVLVTQGSSFVDGPISVSTASAGVIAYVDEVDDDVIVNLYIINGLGAGDAIDVNGSVWILTVDGTYAGSIDMIGMHGDTPYEIGTLVVNGNIDASTADLNVYDFDDIEIEAGFGVINDTAGVSDGFHSGTLDHDNMSVTFTNPSDVTQTVALKAGSKVQMDYDMYFGKMTDVTLTGRGGVQIVSTEASVQTARDVSAIVRDTARYGLPQDTGTAVMGDIDIHGFEKVRINGLVVDGNMGSLDSGLMNVKNMYVNGHTDDVSIGGNINGAFFNGDVDNFFADNAKKVTILGDVDELTVRRATRLSVDGDVHCLDAFKLNRVFIDGEVGHLYMGFKGSIFNSVFGGVGYDNIDHREVVPVVVSDESYDGSAAIYGSEMTNPNYNPVKVRNSVLPGVNMYLSDINNDGDIDDEDVAWVVRNNDVI